MKNVAIVASIPEEPGLVTPDSLKRLLEHEVVKQGGEVIDSRVFDARDIMAVRLKGTDA
jgi:hypothetical protein